MSKEQRGVVNDDLQGALLHVFPQGRQFCSGSEALQNHH